MRVLYKSDVRDVTLMINAAINYIGRANGVSLASRTKYFRRMDVLKIRRWLRDHGLNSHMTVEAFSTEIALKTPDGVVMQIRSGENCLGFFGGELNPDEKPVEGAQRELFEETGLWLEDDEFVPKEIYSHHHPIPAGTEYTIIPTGTLYSIPPFL